MKALLKVGLSLTLGLVPAASFAQELNWRMANSPAAAGAPAVTISRPIPLDDPGSINPAPRSVIRGQNPDDTRPLPPGPFSINPTGPADVKSSPPTFTFAQDQGKVMPRADGFTPPNPQLTMPPANGKGTTPPIWGPPASAADRLLGITGECGDPCPATCAPCCNPCCDPCANACWGSRIMSFFRHDCNTCNTCNPCGDSCGNLCCGSGCNPYGNRPRLWVYADYLLWGQKNQSLPPLVTTSPAGVPLVDPVTGAPIAGVLGMPTTTVAFDRFSNPMQSGMRIGGGLWFTDDCCWGMDASYWFLSPTSRAFALAGDPNTQVFRPLSLVGLGPSAEIVTTGQGPFPTNGAVTVRENQQIWGLDANLRRRLWTGPTCWLDLLIGYRHFSMTEGLEIGENLVPFGGVGGPALGTILISDRFNTSNSYNAPQLGLAGLWQFAPRWSLWGSARVGVGVNNEVVNIAGNTNFLGVPFNAGILAVGTNSGTRSKERFAVMPELNMKLAYDITPNLSIYAGYDFMYISSVVRPGRQIDLTLNPSQIPSISGTTALVGPAVPPPVLRGESFWLQGVNFGLLYKY